MIILIDKNKIITEVNDKTIEILEIPKEQLLNKNFFELFSENEESHNSYQQQFEQCLIQKEGIITMQPHRVFIKYLFNIIQYNFSKKLNYLILG